MRISITTPSRSARRKRSRRRPESGSECRSGISICGRSDRIRAGPGQLTVATGQFGDFAQWAALNRNGLTIFAHAETGDDLADHTEHVIWFGPSEPLDLSIFG